PDPRNFGNTQRSVRHEERGAVRGVRKALTRPRRVADSKAARVVTAACDPRSPASPNPEGSMTVFSAHRRTVTLAAFLAAAAMIVAGCSKKSTGVLSPDGGDLAGARTNGVLSMTNSAVRQVALIQERHTNELMAKPGVVGTATTADDNGNLAVLVLTEVPMGSRLPATLDGVPVIEEVTGKIRAMAVADHEVKQTPPIQMGTSGGWRFDLANGFCCGGTLGSCVNKGGTQYVLSNYHVLEADIVSGGNGRVAQVGDGVV